MLNRVRPETFAAAGVVGVGCFWMAWVGVVFCVAVGIVLALAKYVFFS